VSTGIDLDALIAIAQDGAEIPGGMAGGRVRDAFAARPEACATRLAS
jgi:hydroxymethylglutaryl-CoA lyase